jgi:hypothetical protein
MRTIFPMKPPRSSALHASETSISGYLTAIGTLLIFVDQAGQPARASSCSATCAIGATVLSTLMGNKITP